eukprot:EG_transcript_11546
MWAHVPTPVPDALFHLNQRFQDDPCPTKLGLGVGAYRSEEGTPYVLEVVREAEAALAQGRAGKAALLPPDGDAEFRRCAAELLLGADSAALAEGRCATCQSISGTGAVRVLAELLAQAFPATTPVLISDPTWPNHPGVFTDAGLSNIKYYRYWDATARWLGWEAMKEDLQQSPDGSIVVLHLCSHNPTGADLSPAQWLELADLVVAKRFCPVFDAAYQGYATGDLEADAFGLRHFVSRGIRCCVAQSFAKNFGLYSERAGCALVTCGSASEAADVQCQLQRIARDLYGSPVAHGARIVAYILGSEERRRRWVVELKSMADRITLMRTLLQKELEQLGTPGDWSHITRQIGMFSFLGLTEAQCEEMIRRHHVYSFPANSRISIAGLSTKTCGQLATAMHDAITNPDRL